MSELKSCPFCGTNEAIVVGNEERYTWQVVCSWVRCEIQPSTKICITEEHAIKAWNTRA